MVNIISSGVGMGLAQHYSGCFWLRSRFEWGDGVEQIALLSLGGPIQSAENLHRAKRLSKRKLLLDC